MERVKNIKETSPEKDPRFLTLKTEFISEEAPPEDSTLFLSGKNAGCFYHLAGTYEKKANLKWNSNSFCDLLKMLLEKNSELKLALDALTRNWKD
ncbi:hypothetical protein LEP1GSC037_3197 [Leptospira interrogans str. 2006001854]|uniref:Uncharacterized protein n=1 Tax=Leptospira interrogans str. 2006001854 TaxID=1001590 RepID=M6GMI0_LEPIR|nr:hypothetical protein LEP1GSC037_3197 [Leptospira interrogans str. 2006001854]